MKSLDLEFVFLGLFWFSWLFIYNQDSDLLIWLQNSLAGLNTEVLWILSSELKLMKSLKPLTLKRTGLSETFVTWSIDFGRAVISSFTKTSVVLGRNSRMLKMRDLRFTLESPFI